MEEFLTENNPCGQNLLRIVSMGSSIIAEILRLKDYIPSVFRLETKADQQKYSDIILDFSYLRIAEVQDRKIEDNSVLQDLDDELRETYIELLTRFYLAFESTHQYASDLKHFVEELHGGYYIQQNLESVLQDEEGKQLLCESLFLFGVMLLVLDLHIPGVIRERLLVSYYRYSAAKSHGESNIDDVCMLLRSTGFKTTTEGCSVKSKVINYPEAYFSRFVFDQTFIDMVIGRLRSDDIYNQISIYPHPDHRSTALSSQAGMLFVCLYFSPKILHTQLAQMREITDKFFSDNWVISIYMGIKVNLIDAWEQFNAARAALTPVLETSSIKGLCLFHKEKLAKTLLKTNELLRDGILSEKFVLQNMPKLIELIRSCNVLLRWFILHTSSPGIEICMGNAGSSQKIKQISEIVNLETQFKRSDIFELLMNCSQLELLVKEILRELIGEKIVRWNNFKAEASDRVNELSEAFSGSRPLSKIEKNSNLKTWFAEIGEEIKNLCTTNPNIAGRKIIQLIQVLEGVQEFHNLQSNMLVKQYLKETREFLHSMIQVINVKENILINIQLISDLSYAWYCIDVDYTQIMQENIKKQPKLVIKLRATFLKLSSALEIPLLRINQARSEDLISVSRYYSSELANYIRKVVQIIPETMFNILARIIKLQTEVIKEIPTRLDKDKLREYAQYDERYTVSKLTYSISVFTEGILMMKKTLVGVIELDPKQLLEDGIRKELVRNLAEALNKCLIFNVKSKTNELEDKLLNLSKVMDGYRRSFEYIQDYLNIYGLKILQEEMTRIINYNVEKECNLFLRNKVLDWQSSFQNPTIPIPSFAPVSGDKSHNFIGRLANEILQCTDPKLTIYLDLKSSWYDKKPPHKEIIDSRLFTKVRDAIGPAGLVGLDRLYSNMFISDLKENLEKIQNNITSDKMWLEMLNTLSQELDSQNTIRDCPLKFYATYTNRWIKVWPTILDWLLQLGHKQILRQQIAYELNNSCKFNSKNLESSVHTLNRTLLNELENGLESTNRKPTDAIIFDLNEYLEFTGNYDPLEQIFEMSKNLRFLPLFFFLFTISHLPRLHFLKNVSSLLAKQSKEKIDGMPMLIGIHTILQQFHSDVRLLYVTYLCQYVKSLVEFSLKTKSEITPDTVTTINFLEIFHRTAKLPRKILEDRIPIILLNQFEYLSIGKA